MTETELKTLLSGITPPDEAARAGQKAVVNHQLAAKPEEKREDQRQKAAVFQRARRMLFKRRAGGISRRSMPSRKTRESGLSGTRYGEAYAAARTETSVSRAERRCFRGRRFMEGSFQSGSALRL